MWEHCHYFLDHYQRGSVSLTTNLGATRWTEVFGDERMTAALLDRLTYRGQVLLVDGGPYWPGERLRR